MKALLRGLQHTATICPDVELLRVCTDSYSALKSLEKGPAEQRELIGARIWEVLGRLGCRVHMVHVPGHAGLPGNEAADKEAARGGAMAQEEVAIDLPTARAAIRRAVRADTLAAVKREAARANGSESARRFWAHAKPVTLDTMMGRTMQTAVRRVRSNHWVGAGEYRHRIKVSTDDKCPDCPGTVDTTDHLLLDCPRWLYSRIRHFGGPTPTLNDVLNSPDALAGFLNETGRLAAP